MGWVSRIRRCSWAWVEFSRSSTRIRPDAQAEVVDRRCASLGKMFCLIRLRRINNLSNLGCSSNAWPNHFFTTKPQIDHFSSMKSYLFIFWWPKKMRGLPGHLSPGRKRGDPGFRMWCCQPLRSWRSRQGRLGSVRSWVLGVLLGLVPAVIATMTTVKFDSLECSC